MKKIACVALLVAVSLQAQNTQQPKETPTTPPTRESAPQAQAPERTVVREVPLSDEATKRLLDLGYFNGTQFQGPIRSFPSANCAIPLISIPAPDKGRFPINNTPANPLLDPKIVYAPPTPACAPSAVPQAINPDLVGEIRLILAPVNAETDKKADQK